MTDTRMSEEHTATIDRFIAYIGPEKKEIVTRWIGLPDSPDCQPEVMRLYMEYGDSLRSVTNLMDSLQELLGCDYSTLQAGLKERLVA